MRKSRNIFLVIAIFLLGAQFTVPLSAIAVNKVGIIQVPVGATPDEYYVLKRDGKPVAPLSHNMPVLNGDEVVPYDNKTVILSFIHNDCGELSINEKTTVDCRPQKRQQAGGFLNLLSENILRFFEQRVKREQLLSTNTRVSRGGRLVQQPLQKLNDYPCYPSGQMYVSVWPVNGTTLLNKNSVQFRWTSPEIAQCSEVKLNICPGTNDTYRCQEAGLQVGELKELRLPDQNNNNFIWFITKNNRRISDKYELTVLDNQETENIKRQLEDVRLIYEENFPELSQALYLQIISNSTPGLDLYYDSYQVLKLAPSAGGFYSELISNIYTHYRDVHSPGDLEVKIEAVSGQSFIESVRDGVLYSGDGFKVMLQPKKKMFVYPFIIDTQGSQYNLLGFTQFKGLNAMKLEAGREYRIPYSGEFLKLDHNKGMESIMFLFSSKPGNEDFDFESLVKVQDPHVFNQYLERYDIQMERAQFIHQ